MLGFRRCLREVSEFSSRGKYYSVGEGSEVRKFWLRIGIAMNIAFTYTSEGLGFCEGVSSECIAEITGVSEPA